MANDLRHRVPLISAHLVVKSRLKKPIYFPVWGQFWVSFDLPTKMAVSHRTVSLHALVGPWTGDGCSRAVEGLLKGC